MFLVFKSPAVQTFITHIIANKLSEKLNTRISIGGVDFAFLKTLILHDVYIEDQTKDTLLFIKHLKLNIESVQWKQRILNFKDLTLYSPTIKLKELENGNLNLQFLIDAFSDTTDTSISKPLEIYLHTCRMQNGKFCYKVATTTIPTKTGHIDFANIKLSAIQININSLVFGKDSIPFKINKLSFKEHSGFELNNLTGQGFFHNDKGISLNKLTINTRNSHIRAHHFNLKTLSSDDFNNFTEKVKFDVWFNTSLLHSNDIAYFSEVVRNIQQSVYISGKVRGPLTSLRARDFRIKYRNHTYINGNYDIDGLTETDNPYLSLRFTHLKTHIDDFSNIAISENSKFEAPSELKTLGNIYYSGELSGFVNDFVMYGKLQTQLGNLKTDISIKYDTLKKKTRINGSLTMNNFVAGKIIQLYPLIKNTSLTVSVSSEFFKNTIKGQVKGNIYSLDFNNYTYQNINIDGTFTEKMFDGNLQLNDPNIKLDFLGKIDYSQKVPIFNFMADIRQANLNKLNFVHPDSAITVSLLLDSKIQGLKPDELNGHLDIYQAEYRHGDILIKNPHLSFTATQNSENKEFLLRSDIADIDIKGFFQFEHIDYYLQNFFNHYLPSVNIANIPAKFRFDEQFSVSINGVFKKQLNWIKELIPELKISPNTHFSLNLSYPNHIRFLLAADSIKFNDVTVNKPEVSIKENQNILNSTIHTEEIFITEQIRLPRFSSNIITTNGNQEVYITWDPKDSLIGDAEISSTVQYKNNQFEVFFNPSRLYINKANWYINDGNINISDSVIKVNQAIINEGNQYVYIDGILGKSINDSLSIRINQFNISFINPFIQSSSLSFDGILDGTICIQKALNKPILTINNTIKTMRINNEELGDLIILAEWNDEKQLLTYKADAFRGKINTLTINGNYLTEGIFDASIKLDKWRLNVLEPFINSFASDIKGIASGQLHFNGTLKDPKLEGKLELTKTAFTINYLNTRYNFTGEVDVKNNALVIKEIDIYDEEANRAKLSGQFIHKNFSNFTIDLKLNTERFLFMNTRYTDTSFFYGSVYASGLVNIQGTPDNINITANVQTEKGTKFNLNLESNSQVSQNDFIRIVNKKAPVEQQNQNIHSSLTGLNLSFTIQATPEANVQLIFDSKVGDIIKSQGSGNLRLELKPNGDFLIFGNYVITQGDYLFTLQNIINKKFEVEPGSTISFNGDPLSAKLDIKAAYKIRTTLYELMLDSTYKNRVPVECELFLKNNLLNPSFKFNIKVPNADSRVEGVLAALSEEEVNKQIISLLVLNRFVTPESYKSGVKTIEYSNPNALGVNSSELLTNQLNYWLSQISKTVNLGVNYRPGDVISNEELEVALNTQILNDRITINTNFGVSTNNQTESSTLIGDFDIEAKISKSGKLRAKAFNRTNTNILKDTSPYTQGVGIFYREEFDSWNNLLKKYWQAAFARKNEEN